MWMAALLLTVVSLKRRKDRYLIVSLPAILYAVAAEWTMGPPEWLRAYPAILSMAERIAFCLLCAAISWVSLADGRKRILPIVFAAIAVVLRVAKYLVYHHVQDAILAGGDAFALLNRSASVTSFLVTAVMAAFSAAMLCFLWDMRVVRRAYG